MDDIVKRLQGLNRSPDHDHAFIISPEDIADAVGEIERLRNELFGLNAKLDSVRSVAGLAVAEPLTYANIKTEIRKAPHNPSQSPTPPKYELRNGQDTQG